ncbi:hypothetical protein QYE76_059247 [Lolium multiflorum]|uniref:Uncharacterized protein n=1 Tax=Lolium multiflorum TaxID=4521 RepID=A0AAD8UZN5_LOLMU|nr:hypothetical protein QYE76_059247 [Lolium multiflorum]
MPGSPAKAAANPNRAGRGSPRAVEARRRSAAPPTPQRRRASAPPTPPRRGRGHYSAAAGAWTPLPLRDRRPKPTRGPCIPNAAALHLQRRAIHACIPNAAALGRRLSTPNAAAVHPTRTPPSGTPLLKRGRGTCTTLLKPDYL